MVIMYFDDHTIAPIFRAVASPLRAVRINFILGRSYYLRSRTITLFCRSIIYHDDLDIMMTFASTPSGWLDPGICHRRGRRSQLML